MDRARVVDRRADALLLQMILQRPPVAGDADRVLMEDVTPTMADNGNLHPLESFAQVASVGNALFVPGRQFFQLN